jgi:hypothetical protein
VGGCVVSLGCCASFDTTGSQWGAFLPVVKNYTKGYSDVQLKVREATSNDPWGPAGTLMNEIAQLSYNQSVLSLLGSDEGDDGGY